MHLLKNWIAVALVISGCARPIAPRTAASPAAPATAQAVDPFEKEIRAFEAADRAQRMPRNAIVFYGSSSMRMWSTLASDFPGLPVVNRGFGGSQTPDAIKHLERVVIPNRPRTVLIYEGDNDIAAGRSPEQVIADARELVRQIHRKLPRTRVIYLAIKPSPSRITMLAKQQQVNAALAAMAAKDPKLDFVDVATPMLDANGQPRPELYLKDQLHMTPTGYELWTKVLAPHLR